MATETPEPEHRVWVVPVISSRIVGQSFVYGGSYSQSQVRCRCGYREVVVAQLADTYGRAHYRHHGVKPQPMPYGYNGGGD
ncbi:MAG: hypothetical protein OJJ54_25010 [Pseudonocardia sp.]|nr:hypothetical protein [Pseudonocardia sp.]